MSRFPVTYVTQPSNRCLLVVCLRKLKPSNTAQAPEQTTRMPSLQSISTETASPATKVSPPTMVHGAAASSLIQVRQSWRRPIRVACCASVRMTAGSVPCSSVTVSPSPFSHKPASVTLHVSVPSEPHIKVSFVSTHSPTYG